MMMSLFFLMFCSGVVVYLVSYELGFQKYIEHLTAYAVQLRIAKKNMLSRPD